MRIAISGFDGLDNPHPGAPVARALREGWDETPAIVALGYDPLMTAAWMPGMADRICILPGPTAGDEPVFSGLLEIHAETPLDAVIPCLDLDVPVFARLAARLRREGIRTLLPDPESIYRTGKLRLRKLCHDLREPAPATIHVADLADLQVHADQFGYPLVVKSIVSGARTVSSPGEAVIEARKLNDRWGGGVLLQRPVAGEEIVACAVAGQDGDCCGLAIMRKVGVNEAGKAVTGTIVDDPELERHVRELLVGLDWRGPVEFEFIRPRDSSRPVLIEINCRFPSWIMLSHWAGANLPVAALREMTGGDGQAAAPRAGTTFIRDISETAVDLDRLRRLEREGSVNGATAPPARARQVSGIRVAVSGIGTLEVVNSGLGTARALRDAPGIAAVYGFGYGQFDSGLYRPDLFDATFRLPASNDPEDLLDRVLDIHRAAPFDIVFPCLDGEIQRYISIRDRLREAGIATLLPTAEALERRSKTGLFPGSHDDATRAFAIPRTELVGTAEEATRAAERLGWPVMVKGPVSLAVRADDQAAVGAAWERLYGQGTRELMVQEFVEGESFATATVLDPDHRPLAALTIKKLRLCERGSTWCASVVPQPALELDFTRFLADLGWTGPAEGEFIRDEMTERFHLIEINPRFTAWIGFSASGGVNHPLAAVHAALGTCPPEPEPARETVFMRCCEDLPVSPSALAAISTRGYLRHG